MIYKKDVNFPYPVLNNSSNSYKNCSFELDVKLSENKDIYDIEMEYTIDSYFINELLEHGRARLFLIIQSMDNKFFEIKLGQKNISINKNRLSLSRRTQIQMMVEAYDEIYFKDNGDICGLYAELKEEIVVSKNSVLGFSNVVTFDESSKKGLELFEKRVDPEIRSEIKIDLTSDSIVITYKKEEMMFNDVLADTSINNLYIYMGLQRALHEFILNNRVNEEEQEVIISEMEEPELELDLKLYRLMKNKLIEELSKDNIDEVIYLISDGIIERFTNTIRGYINDRG
ncbi:hypothetical protein [Clostridium sp. C8-1-8]|uniref:hypothetical protein n=1 Tax=Clostridium sp. C8-1-8 TaxID=2698831 RepID=UPI00136EA4F1|nr:hypothetical protein [Clostridium sp. C8-1-8]